MDASVKVENVKSEVESNMLNAESFLDMNQVTNLAAHLQLMQQAEGQVPWMISPYQMMVFSQGVSPSLITQNLLALQQDSDNSAIFTDGQVAETLAQSQQLEAVKSGLVATVADSSLVPQLMSAQGTNLTTINSGIIESSVSNSTTKSKAAVGRPPKKPLTPYMIFSKQIWPNVKAANSHLSSVCEIGAIVGGLWRDMDVADKKVYNDLFAKDKERYDRELREYLKATGMSASDLAKPRVKRTISGVKVNPSPSQSHGQTINQLTNQVQSFNGTPTSSGAQVTSEQIFAHMDLSASLVQASDGTINLDANGLANLLALQQQQLLATKQGDIPSTLDGSDHMGTWMLQQHQPSDTFSNNLQQQTAVLNIHPALSLTSNAHMAPIGAAEHLIKNENDHSAMLQTPLSELEAEVIRTRALLSNAASDVERLTGELQEAFMVIQHWKQINESSLIIPKIENDGGLYARQGSSPSSSAVHLADADRHSRDAQECKLNDEHLGNHRSDGKD